MKKRATVSLVQKKEQQKLRKKKKEGRKEEEVSYAIGQLASEKAKISCLRQ